MKDYGHLLRDDPEWAERAEAFSAQVRDVTELLAEGEPRAPRAIRCAMRVAYHDACHLAHAQGVRSQPRELLRPDPGPRAGRARRMGDLLRLGRRLQPARSPSPPPSWDGARPRTCSPPAPRR